MKRRKSPRSGKREPAPADPARHAARRKLELYNLEGCPFCAIVRDILDELGLDYVVHEVPGMRFLRSAVRKISGQSNVPVLIDPNRDVILPESEDIIAYLREHYGKR